MQKDQQSLAIVSAVTAMSRSLGVPVTAEGVEDGEAVRRLREVGCDKAQGWHFGRPRSAEETRLILDAKGLVRRPLMAEPDVTAIPPHLDVGRAA